MLEEVEKRASDNRCERESWEGRSGMYLYEGGGSSGGCIGL